MLALHVKDYFKNLILTVARLPFPSFVEDIKAKGERGDLTLKVRRDIKHVLIKEVYLDGHTCFLRIFALRDASLLFVSSTSMYERKPGCALLFEITFSFCSPNDWEVHRASINKKRLDKTKQHTKARLSPLNIPGESFPSMETLMELRACHFYSCFVRGGESRERGEVYLMYLMHLPDTLRTSQRETRSSACVCMCVFTKCSRVESNLRAEARSSDASFRSLLAKEPPFAIASADAFSRCERECIFMDAQ